MIGYLGVFSEIYGPGAEMTVGRALLISLVGFSIVFLILGVIALFVKAMGAAFDAAAKKRAAAQKLPAQPAPAAPPAGAPLPDGVSQGTLVLEDVTEEEAAVVMAVTAHRTGIPLNRLQFRSIKLIKEADKQ